LQRCHLHREVLAIHVPVTSAEQALYDACVTDLTSVRKGMIVATHLEHLVKAQKMHMCCEENTTEN